MTLFFVIFSFCVMGYLVGSIANEILGSSRSFYQQRPRSTFRRTRRSDPETIHEIVIAIQPMRTEELREIVYDRSDPRSSKYQKWLTFEEVGDIVRNPEASRSVVKWLESHYPMAKIVWSSSNLDYLRVVAPVSELESMLSAEFYKYEDATRTDPITSLPMIYHRTSSYSIPKELDTYISAIFHTIQIPPSERKEDELPSSNLRANLQSAAPVTLDWLNTFYQIESNTADQLVKQTILGVGESFSPRDLAAFQTRSAVPAQSALLVDAKEAPPCTAYSCLRTNAALQFQMGLAQGAASSFWFVDGGGDPFVRWILEAAEHAHPPRVVVVPSSELESAVDSSVVRHWEHEAMKLTGRGVTLIAASGDDGAANRQLDQCLCAGQVRAHGSAHFSSLPLTSSISSDPRGLAQLLRLQPGLPGLQRVGHLGGRHHGPGERQRREGLPEPAGRSDHLWRRLLPTSFAARLPARCRRGLPVPPPDRETWPRLPGHQVSPLFPPSLASSSPILNLLCPLPQHDRRAVRVDPPGPTRRCLQHCHGRDCLRVVRDAPQQRATSPRPWPGGLPEPHALRAGHQPVAGPAHGWAGFQRHHRGQQLLLLITLPSHLSRLLLHWLLRCPRLVSVV